MICKNCGKGKLKRKMTFDDYGYCKKCVEEYILRLRASD